MVAKTYSFHDVEWEWRRRKREEIRVFEEERRE